MTGRALGLTSLRTQTHADGFASILDEGRYPAVSVEAKCIAHRKSLASDMKNLYFDSRDEAALNCGSTSTSSREGEAED